MKQELIANGAEGLIYLANDKNYVKKVRVSKDYRIKEIDIDLRKRRTRQEARILKKLENINFPSPKVFEIDEDNFTLCIEYIQGNKVRDIINKKNCKLIAKELARLIVRLHKLNIVHHDLTTSNMIVFEEKLFLIDFGLSFVSKKVEDKAVDIHLLKRAIESKHPLLFEEFMKEFADCYQSFGDKDVLKRVNVVDLRGRYK